MKNHLYVEFLSIDFDVYWVGNKAPRGIIRFSFFILSQYLFQVL